jgi:hypothetical protein
MLDSAAEDVQIKHELEDARAGRTPGAPSKPAAISKEWLIYGHGSEPYDLSLCERSMPLSHRGSSDLLYLRTLLDNGT